MSIRKVWASRVKNITAEQFVGQKGTIFFNEVNGALRISDGTTVGGLPLTLVASDFQFQFGDFIATTNPGPNDGACLSSAKLNQDVNLVSNGTGSVNVVGEFNVHKTNNNVEDALAAAPIFKIGDNGYTTIRVPTTGSTTGAVEIIGSLSGASQSPVNTGVMLHITGNNNDASRIYNDSIGSFAAFVARRYNGTAALPTAVLANEEIMRLSGTAHNGTSIPGTANQRITFKTLGNQTLTNAGGAIEFAATPLNSTTLTTIATIDSTGLTINSGKVVLAAGTATAAPLTFTSGTNKTVPTTGTMEYDGRVFYATPLDAERGLIATQQWYSLNADRNLTFNTTTAQPLFAVSPNLSANTRYWFGLKFIVSRTTGTNTTALTLGWGGTATLSRISQTVQSKTGTLNTVGTENMVEHIITTNFSTQLAITATSNAPSQHTVIVTGFFNIGANGGTVTPNITWEGATAAGAVTVYTGSNFQLWPVSATGADTQVGNWT